MTLTAQPYAVDPQVLPTGGTLTVESRKKDALLGRSIDGRYQIESLIGVGGMGTVYRATRLLIGDEVAIKILHIDRGDTNSAERFRREAQAAARLKHPNAVSIYDFGVSSDGLQYLVMEFVEGESLREKIKLGPLEFSSAAEITAQICAALDEAHRRQIVHRDIKPDNIILHSTPYGLRVKVLDFGIAKLRDETASHITQTGSVMGTPHYMSPEQCLGEELDSRADIYSVGIVLYEMLCGRVPFNSPISTAVVVQHVSQPPPSLRSINPGIPERIEAVVLHAIEKSRDSRPATAGALAEELTAALNNLNIPALSAGFRPQPASPSQPGINIDEETVERQRARTFHPQSDLPQTIHLASPRLGVPSLASPGRHTAESDAAVTTNLKKTVPLKYVIGAVVVLTAGVPLILLLWLWNGESSNKEATAVNHNSTQNEVAPDVPVASSSSAKRSGKPSTPESMVLVSGAQFLMGSNEWDEDSKPAHMVKVNSFYLDTHEVTCEEYKRFIDATGHRAPQNWKRGNYPSGASRQPVTWVSWEDAAAYAQWAGKRLPTEQEWELAARGQAGLRYPWGNSWKSGCANADIEGKERKSVLDVGSYNCASPFGAQDLIGNAWEWTASEWAAYPGGRLLNSKGGGKVIRGGSWESPGVYATALIRAGYDEPGDQTGFRCVKDMP